MTEAMYTYSYGTAGWLALQSVPLILSPETYLAVVRGISPNATSTPLEQYLTRSLGLSLIPTAILTIILTGSIPLTSSFSESQKRGLEDPIAPYALPTIILTALFHAGSAAGCYGLWKDIGDSKEGQRMFMGFCSMVSAALAGIGLIVFLMAVTGGSKEAAEKVGVVEEKAKVEGKKRK